LAGTAVTAGVTIFGIAVGCAGPDPWSGLAVGGLLVAAVPRRGRFA
jgi:hypothetical protein